MIHITWTEQAFDFCFAFLCKYAKWLNIKGRRWCFIIWMICGVYWLVVDLQRGLYAQALFCIPTILFQAYGFYEWRRKGFGEPATTTPATKEPRKRKFGAILDNPRPVTSEPQA